MSKKIGKPAPQKSSRANFVQTELATHEAWAKLILKHPKAAALLHFFVSRMDHSSNSVVASHSVLAKFMGCSTKSIKNYIKQLQDNKWVQVVSLGKGATNAYVINSTVAWAKSRDKFEYSSFTAQVIVDKEDQSVETLEAKDLRAIPSLFDGDLQVPAGDGIDPPSQPSIEGLEPDLPTKGGDSHLQQDLLEQG